MKNMKKIVLFSGVTLIFAVMSGCSENTISPTSPFTNTPVSITTSVPTTVRESTPEVPTNIVYENTNYNFTLKLPKSWEGKFDVKDVPVNDGNNINFKQSN